ncbi:Gamma-aminobutyric acid receptor subunit beta [Trichinella zimbabwensis]|uniref:Gamma-aminobutyric acid receptor subunit beta n=1 Tax=Trichinella zimbabwensis TaxID=268475 RepID=A0A0V1HTD8_9BILA|nr:Gamma-aminobutyric acid receptor subunit beta [Trichinella zimbabwensis]
MTDGVFMLSIKKSNAGIRRVLIDYNAYISIMNITVGCYHEQFRKVSELSRNITHILNILVNKTYYDKRLRPNYGGRTVDVGITMHVSSISAVSEVEMDYTLDFYLRQNWMDPRLNIKRLGAKEELTVGWEYTKDIWVPDTFFPNEKKSYMHTATTHNSFLRIKGSGEVLTSQRLTVTASCPMLLHLFPLDSQECTLEIESYGYSEADTKYRWLENKTVTMDEVFLPQFYVAHFTMKNRTITLSTGNYSRLHVKFVFVRNIGFYMMQIYIPSMLIVIISWVSFWIHRDASPARVALGVTTVLTMTTLMTTTNASLPKVSYIKAIDIYLGTCFVMVFASLIEYAAVSYLNKKVKMKQERRKQQQTVQHMPPPLSSSGILSSADPMMASFVSSGSAPRSSFYPYTSSAKNRAQYRPNAKRFANVDMSPSLSMSQLECDCDMNQIRPVPMRIVSRPKLRRHMLHHVTPSSIDKYSRIMFPLFFLFFNAVYWISYGYSDADIRLFWLKGFQSVTFDAEIRKLPTFELQDLFIVERKITLSTGDYSRLTCHLTFSRNLSFYWVQIYQPALMVVMISWVSFWISRESAPARVTLGIMTVLTMTTLMTTTNGQLPKVSYVKAVDIYLGFCYVMVFCALIEYAFVTYKDKRKKRQKIEDAFAKVAQADAQMSAGPSLLTPLNRLPPPMHETSPNPWQLSSTSCQLNTTEELPCECDKLTSTTVVVKCINMDASGRSICNSTIHYSDTGISEISTAFFEFI